MVRLYRSRPPAGLRDVALAVDGLESKSAHMSGLLRDEAARLRLTPEDAAGLVCGAQLAVRWAESRSEVCEDRTIARFAAEVTYDENYRMKLNSVLGQCLPTRWLAVRESTGGATAQRLGSLGSPVGLRPAFQRPGDLHLVAVMTPQYEAGKAEVTNNVEPYVHKNVRRPLGWALDPMRPPMAAIRFAASIIDQHVRSAGEPDAIPGLPDLKRRRLNLLILEGGLTAAPQALAWFLPGATVHSAGSVLGQPAPTSPKCDAVVLNLANRRARALALSALTAEVPLTRWDLGKLHDIPKLDPGDHCEGLVAVALEHLADNGVLVVLGDVESGIHHDAVSAVTRHSFMEPIKLTADGRPVAFLYTEEPWTLFGCLPATDRFVSAWKRTR